jgi:hypothetical protein
VTDLRALFFAGAAAVSGGLIPLTPATYRWLPVVLVIVYALLAGASFLDSRSRHRAGAEPRQSEQDQPNRPVM